MNMYYECTIDGSEIGRRLGGISRQAVSNTLKRAMKKFYKGVSKLDSTWTPFQCACTMMKMFSIPNNESEIKKFYNLFPSDVKREIMESVSENNNSLELNYPDGD